MAETGRQARGRKKNEAPEKKHSLSQYYNASLFRADSWNRLKNVCQRLAEGRARETDPKRARELYDQIAPMEEYFAFPGRHFMQTIIQYLREEDFEAVFPIVNRIVGALMSESYRSKHLQLESHADDVEFDEENDEPDERDRRRPYFEVLIVDDLTLAQQRQQRDNLTALRRQEDPFTYEPLAWAINKGDPDFLNYLNNFLRQSRGDGFYDRMYKKWITGTKWKSELE